MRLLEGAAQALVLELLVAEEVDPADLHPLLAVDQEGHRHGLSRRTERVVVDAHVHRGVAETLLGPVFLDEFLVLVDDVVRKLAVGLEFELLGQVLLLALRNTLEIPVIDARPLLEEHLQVDAVPVDLGPDLHVREEALAPQAGNGVSDEVARQVDRIARDQTRRRLENLLVQILHAADVDVADIIAAGRAVVAQHGSVFGKCGRRGRRRILRIRLLSR